MPSTCRRSSGCFQIWPCFRSGLVFEKIQRVAFKSAEEKWVNLADEIEISGDCDYTKEIPDECLACVFHFLASRYRTHCSLVCKRWLCVEGQSRYRLSINAKSLDCKSLKKLSCGSCNFGAKGMNAVLDHCATLEELSIKRLIAIGIYDGAGLVSAGAASSSCSNLGLVSVAESCKQLRKLHIDGWRINRIGDEGLMAIAEHCLNLQELVLIGVNWWHDQLGIAQCGSEISELWSSLL